MNKTTYNLSISAGDASANVNSTNPGDLLRLLQLAGQNPGEKNYNLNVNSSSQDDAAPGSLTQSQSLSLQTRDPNHIARLLQLSGQAAPEVPSAPFQQIGPKPCGCPGPCDCGAEEPKSCGCDGPCDCELECDAPGAMMAESIHREYPDTAEGAIQALGDMSTHKLKGATATPDPQVDGVWLVKYPQGQSIVYLKKGSEQPMNDFEDINEGIDETADYDAGMHEPTEEMDEFGFPTFSKAGTAGEPERLTKASGGSNPLRAEEEDLTEAFYKKIQLAWKSFVSENDEKFRNKDGQSSPLSASERNEFDQDPFADQEPDVDGSDSPMTNIERQHIPR